jgi:hypothetical protein
MEKEKDVLTPEEIEQILRKLEVEFPDSASSGKNETAEKPGHKD